jgi:hypothetical protein
MEDNSRIIVNMMRNGDLDINIQDLFLSLVIKGLLYNLNKSIKIRGKEVPHFILHTGDDRMWIEMRGYDNSVEPLKLSNENNIYSIIPKCIVNPSSIDLISDQLTSPYSKGKIQYTNTSDELYGVYSLYGEFRRVPLKLSVDLKYYTDSFTDMLELIQYILTNFAFVRNYDIMYMGQKIKCSYKIPESFGEEHSMDIDGSMSDNREHSLNLSIEVETNIPVFDNRTIVSATDIITKTSSNIILNNTNEIK